MYVDTLLPYLQKRFAKQLEGLDQEKLKEELYCRFLLTNANHILREGSIFLEKLPGLSDPAELRSIEQFLQGAKKKEKLLLIGDEMGLFCQAFSDAAFVFYQQQSIDFAVSEGIKEAAFLDDANWGGESFQRIAVLNLMGGLISRASVAKLRFFLEKVYNLAGRKGRILIFDKNEYQDDFVCQCVDIGAEIEALETTCRSFILRILP